MIDKGSLHAQCVLGRLVRDAQHREQGQAVLHIDGIGGHDPSGLRDGLRVRLGVIGLRASNSYLVRHCGLPRVSTGLRRVIDVMGCMVRSTPRG